MVTLSQEEVDKLLGIGNSSSPSKISKKEYIVEKFLSENQLSEIKEVCKSAYKFFKISMKKKFGQPKIRKLTISSVSEQNINEFFDLITDNDFLYEASFSKAKAYIKFDSFLFGALSGMKIDPKHQINVFQSEVLRDFVVTFLVEGFARQLKKNTSPKIESLLGKKRKSSGKGKTGLCVTVNWNENLRSFGIEKIFLTKELISSFRIVE